MTPAVRGPAAADSGPAAAIRGRRALGRRGSPRRRGLSALLAVLALVTLVVAVGTLRLGRTRRVLSSVHRAQLAGLAMSQAQSAVQELLAEVGRDANRPGTALYRRFREGLADGFERLDLAPALAGPEIEWMPRWGLKGAGPRGKRALAKIDRFSAVVRAPRQLADGAGSEEWVGALTLGADVTVSDAAGRASRYLAETFEVRVQATGVPRPFDQLALYLGDVAAAVDVAAANRVRDALVARAAALRDELAAIDTAAWPAPDAAYLGRVVAGMPDRAAAEARTPRLPPGPAALTGFYHMKNVPLRDLDLAARGRAVAGKLAGMTDRLRAASPAPGAVLDAAYPLASEMSNALDAIWSFGRTMGLHPRAGAPFRNELAPFEARLSPGYFAARAHLVAGPDHPDVAGWLRGEVGLEGVLDLRDSPRPLRLEGALRGRVTVLVGPEGAALRGVNGPRGPDRLTVVSFGGDVSVAGRCGAGLVMLARGTGRGSRPGALRFGDTAHLRGGVYLPRPDGERLALRGFLSPEPAWLAPWPPGRPEPGPGTYVVAVAPQAMFARGGAL